MNEFIWFKAKVTFSYAELFLKNKLDNNNNWNKHKIVGYVC